MRDKFFFNTDEFFFNNYLSEFAVNDYPISMVIWNLFLLLIPFFLYLLFKKFYSKTGFKKVYEKIIAFVLFFFWLIFIPNTAYVITDVRHLLDYCPRETYLNVCVSNAWMIIFFFIYSLLGWIFLVLFLNQMKKLFARIFSEKISVIFIFLIIPLISLGVLLGLLDRFNSWYIFTHPLLILENMLIYITNMDYFKNFFSFTVGLYILYFLGNYLFKDKFNKND